MKKNTQTSNWLENYNDSQTTAPQGFEGDGYSNVGRNYSPAWGGQFQMGGSVYPVNYVPQAQNGLWKENRKAFVDSTLQANKHLDFVKRLYDQSKGSIQIPGVHGRSTHYMADDKNRIYPTVVNKNGKLTYLSDPDQAWDYANDTGEYIDFKTPEQASWFANSPNHSTGYKMGTNVLTSIPKHQMGGSIPGATGHMYARYEQGGDIDFSYPRTKGIPYNGPGAKKTMASAQEGVKLDMYGAPITAIEVTDPNLDRSHYDPRLNIVSIGNDYNIWHNNKGEQITGKELEEHRNKLKTHEHYHAKQHKEGRDNYDIAHHTNNEQWAQMQKRPQMMATDSEWNKFYNRGDIENTQDYTNYINAVPEARILNPKFLFDKVLDSSRYANPFNQEGEAMYYEQMGKEFSPYEFNVPKNKNGGWLNKYDVAEDGIETTTNETTKPIIDFSKLKQDLANIKNNAKARRNNIQLRELPRTVVKDVIPTVKPIKQVKLKKQYVPEDVSKLNIPEQVTNQIDYVTEVDNPKQNFAIADKDANIMYYINPQGQIIGHENIITGATNKDKEHAPSMLEYGKTANEYYDYLKNTNQRVTPEGVYTLRSNKNDSYGKPHSLWDRAIGMLPFTDEVKLNTLDDPSLLHAIYNEMPWREEQNKEYYDHRKESYGPTGNMFRMVSQYGVPSSKGIHGTGNVNRINALNNSQANRNLSNGCINVGGKTMCFDMLQDKSKLYILPEEKDEFGQKWRTESKKMLYRPFGHYTDSDKENWVDDQDLPISREDIKNAKATRDKIAAIVKNNKINATELEIDFAAAVAQKETKGGKSWMSSLESTLPGFSSYGLYEQKEDFPYLKGKSPNDEVASTQAVIDFYRDMMKKHPELEYEDWPLEKIYSTYNSGKEDWDTSGVYHGTDFRKVLQAVRGYKDGGIVKDNNGYWNPDNWNGPVEIGSNDITMKGVPFDVVGISDEGDIQHMKANNPTNYKYKGKKVTEFRMAKNGIRQEQKGLVNLNQLTNFTNYNTKQPGGWLDKYN